MIPKILHQVWPGDDPIPRKFRDFTRGWLKLHPDWRYILWDMRNIPSLDCYPHLPKINGISSRSNVIRLEVVRDHGGVYADLDFECRRALTPLIEPFDAFAGYETPGLVCNALFGATPQHPWIQYQWNRVPDLFAQPPPWGPGLMTEACAKFGVKVFDPPYFYPYYYNEWHRRNEPFPDAYAIHRWCWSWNKDTSRRRFFEGRGPQSWLAWSRWFLRRVSRRIWKGP